MQEQEQPTSENKDEFDNQIVKLVQELLPQLARSLRRNMGIGRYEAAESALQGAVLSLYANAELKQSQKHDALSKRLLRSASKRLRTNYNHLYANQSREVGDSQVGVTVDNLLKEASVATWFDESCDAIVQECVGAIQPDRLNQVARMMLAGADAEMIAAEMDRSVPYTRTQIVEVLAQAARISRREAHPC